MKFKDFLHQAFKPAKNPTVIIAVGDTLFTVTKTRVWKTETGEIATAEETKQAREKIAKLFGLAK